MMCDHDCIVSWDSPSFPSYILNVLFFSCMFNVKSTQLQTHFRDLVLSTTVVR
jgi:hypothetical protein